mmetsp:Transcript_25207/g.49241  ORF Transcript_25207/g.49241 Transcript_25207/m.49241 type:complete len:354 (-) Transcript_25207:1153-2214(-)
MDAVGEVEKLFTLCLDQTGRRNAGGHRNDCSDVVNRHLVSEQTNARLCHSGFILVSSGLELALQLRKCVESKLGSPVEVKVSLRLFDFDLHDVDLLFEGSDRVHLLLLRLPLIVQRCLLGLQTLHLTLNRLHSRSLCCRACSSSSVCLDGDSLHLQLQQPSVELIQSLGLGGDLNLQLGGCLVHQVDRLVGQEPVCDVPVRELGSGHEGRVHDTDSVMDLISLLETSENRGSGIDGGLVDHHSLEPSFQGLVLLNVLTVFVHSRRTNAPKLSPCKERLQKVSCIQGSLSSCACPHHCVNFINKHHNVSRCILYLLQHCLQSLLKFTPVLCTSKQSAHIKGNQLTALERVWHVS